jgi:hypothetical protein
MQLTTRILLGLSLSVACAFGGEDELSIKSSFYNQTDGGGNENIDEDASVFETIIFVNKNLDENDDVSVRILADVFTAASVERNHNAEYRANQSGASGDVVVGGTLGWKHAFEKWDWSSNANINKEYSYLSLGVGTSGSFSFNEDNTTVSLSLQMYQDTVDMIRYNGVNEDDEDRNTYTVNLSLTQILTPRSLLDLTLSHTEQDGFLATQYSSVFINGEETYEILPDTRSRDSITVRYKHAVGETDAWEGGVRQYTDDWGIGATTLDLRYFKYASDDLLFEPTYRLHAQSEADYYKPSFTAAETYQTSDPDLGDFLGHMVGLKTTFIDRELLWLEGDWDVGGYFYTRDNGLDMFWLTFGYRTTF